MLDFEGSSKFRDNKLTTHNSPYDSHSFQNFEIFIGEKSNFLSILYYNILFDISVQVSYNNSIIYNNVIKPSYFLVETDILFNQLDINKFIIMVNNNELKIDKEIVNYCKII